MSLDLGCHGWPSHSISVDDNLLRKSLGVLLELTHCFVNEGFDDVCTLDRDENFLYFSARFAWILLLMTVRIRHPLLVHFSVALSHSLG